jgi:hypothetical protein
MVEKILLDLFTMKWDTQDVMNNTSSGVLEITEKA